MINRIMLLVALTLPTLGGGCALETLVDCRNLCERYQECVDPDTDVSSCASRCESRVDSGEMDRADRCDACLDSNETCAAALVSCSDDCGSLLAP